MSSDMVGGNWMQELGPMDQDVHNEWSSSVINNSSDYSSESYHSNITTESCRLEFAQERLLLEARFGPEGFCDVVSDGLKCWPPTAIDQTAIIKCFSSLFDIKYDDTQNASRTCQFNATWAKSNYSSCKEIIPYTPDVFTQTTIYFVGYTVSLIALSIAVGIFTYFKELRCLRNMIHMHLMWSYILTYAMWIITLIVLHYGGSNFISCFVIVTLLHYFNVTTFFWMFVEGLYLYILVVETLTRENFKLRVYVCIGWGLPAIFIISWDVAKLILLPAKIDPADTWSWFYQHPVDWVFQGPTLVVLLMNLGFLLAIMYVLITKLRSANTLEQQQYHKAAKALLVLMPLLGITYIITIYTPSPDQATHNIFECIRSVLLSTQGFTVAMFYCVLNTEVQNTVKHHYETWKTRRSLGPSRLRSGSRSRDWSPRSRTESLRLYSHPTNMYHKRESCTSEVTTTTLVTVNGGTMRPTNGSGPQVRSPFLHPPRQSYGGNV